MNNVIVVKRIRFENLSVVDPQHNAVFQSLAKHTPLYSEPALSNFSCMWLFVFALLPIQI